MTEAPRWRLNSAHYLNVPELPDGTRVEWEHKETDRTSGRSVRKLYSVPIILNPNDQADCNYPGEIIVSSFVEGARIPARDYIFIGDPTPEMEPLNDEAQAIIEPFRLEWARRQMEPMSAGGLAQASQLNSLEQSFLNAMTKAFANGVPAANAPLPSDDYNEMKERVAKLEALIAAQAKPAPAHTDRRI